MLKARTVSVCRIKHVATTGIGPIAGNDSELSDKHVYTLKTPSDQIPSTTNLSTIDKHSEIKTLIKCWSVYSIVQFHHFLWLDNICYSSVQPVQVQCRIPHREIF